MCTRLSGMHNPLLRSSSTKPQSGALTPTPFAPEWGLERLGVRTHLSTRTGGVSEGAYASLNLGLHVGDVPERVAHNRQVYAQHLGASPVFLNQVHGCRVLELLAQSPAPSPNSDRDPDPDPDPDPHSTPATNLSTQNSTSIPTAESADSAWTQARGVACTMMVADCMPVLLADSHGRVVAAVHVGWRGLVGLRAQAGASALETNGGVIAQTLTLLRQRLSMGLKSSPAPEPDPVIYAWLGPCIGPTAFEVGEEVRDWFVERRQDNARAFKPSAVHAGKWMAHLSALVQWELERNGVGHLFGNLASTQSATTTPDTWCTVTNAEDFFSYRRQGVCGRFAASIWLDDPQS